MAETTFDFLLDGQVFSPPPSVPDGYPSEVSSPDVQGYESLEPVKTEVFEAQSFLLSTEDPQVYPLDYISDPQTTTTTTTIAYVHSSPPSSSSNPSPVPQLSPNSYPSEDSQNFSSPPQFDQTPVDFHFQSRTSVAHSLLTSNPLPSGFNSKSKSPSNSNLDSASDLDQNLEFDYREQTPDFGKKGAKVTAKRAEQNRQAQKNFRERKMKYVKDLEDRLEEAAKQSVTAELLRQENEDLRSVILSLKQENERLRTERNQANFVWQPEKSFQSAQFAARIGVPLITPNPNSGQPPVDPYLLTSQNRTLSLSFSDKPKADGQTVNSNDWDLDALLQSSQTPSTDGFVQSSTGSSSQDQSLGLGGKRTLDEAKIYNSYTPLSFLAPVFSKDEDANRDDLETQLCDLLKKIHCKDKNPSGCQGAKYVKKTN